MPHMDGTRAPGNRCRPSGCPEPLRKVYLDVASTMHHPLPAHQTKGLALLPYALSPTSLVLMLSQSDGLASTTGSTLWLGSQLLSLYLFDLYASKPPVSGVTQPRAIELGAGIGLTSLALASLGFDVVATDVGEVVDRVLRQNVDANLEIVWAWATNEGQKRGSVHVRELDWFVEPAEWRWNNVVSVTLPPSGADVHGGDAGPPFDLIVTSDTLYTMELVDPLLRTLKTLSEKSRASGGKFPLVLVALEVRDAAVINHAVDMAKQAGFECKKVPDSRVRKCMVAARVDWKRDEWEGVEIWRWKLKKQAA